LQISLYRQRQRQCSKKKTKETGGNRGEDKRQPQELYCCAYTHIDNETDWHKSY